MCTVLMSHAGEPMDWIIGAVCASLVAGAAYAKKSLTLSGCLAAILMGTIYYGAGNLFWFGTLLLFFITSTLLSRFRKDRKQEMEKSYAKTGNRDAGQVMANGGIGMLLCLANWIMPHPAWLYAFIGVMATVTSDTCLIPCAVDMIRPFGSMTNPENWLVSLPDDERMQTTDFSLSRIIPGISPTGRYGLSVPEPFSPFRYFWMSANNRSPAIFGSPPPNRIEAARGDSGVSNTLKE